MDVKLTVVAKPNSRFGIMGVDESLLLNSGNDIAEVSAITVVCFTLNHVTNILVQRLYCNRRST